MFAALTTRVQRASSDLIIASKRSGGPVVVCMPSFASWLPIVPCCSTLLMSALSLAITAAGVPAGTSAPYQVSTSSCVWPCSRKVGTCGNALERAPLVVRLPRKRKPAALGFLERVDEALPEERQGLAVSTLGKVIRRGWDWIGLSSASPALVTGVIEAPGLAAALTLNKGDFLRTGRGGITYLAYRKAIQEAVQAQLAAWGEGRDGEPGRHGGRLQRSLLCRTAQHRRARRGRGRVVSKHRGQFKRRRACLD